MPFAVQLGEFELLARIGSGPSTNVFLAKNELRRYVVLKALAPPFAERPDCRDRLIAEAKAGARLAGHLNIVRVHAFPQLLGAEVLVMDHVFGATLEEVLAREGSRGLPLDVVVAIMSGLCDALTHAHQRRVHANVSARNVLLAFDGSVKLTGFERAPLDEAANVYALASLLHDMLPGKHSSLPPPTRFLRAAELKEAIEGIRVRLRDSRELAPVAALLRHRFQARIARGAEMQGDPASTKDLPVSEHGSTIADPHGLFVRAPFAHITEDLELD